MHTHTPVTGLIFVRLPNGVFQYRASNEELPLRLVTEALEISVVNSGWIKDRIHLYGELPTETFVCSLPVLPMSKWRHLPYFLRGEHSCQAQ